MPPVADTVARAVDLSTRLNNGESLDEACVAAGIDVADLFSEDPSVFALDDADNALIDFGWEGRYCVTLCRSVDRRQSSPWLVEVATRVTGSVGGVS